MFQSRRETTRMTTTPKSRTSGGNALNVLTDDELGSAAQRDRRKRILDATIALASKGGFEAVQMRAVAERADVALGTLYRYFPSKIHLLVSGLAREPPPPLSVAVPSLLLHSPPPLATATRLLSYYVAERQHVVVWWLR